MTAPVAILGFLSVVGGFLFVHSITEFVTGPLPPTSIGHGEEGALSLLIGSLPGIFGIALAAYLFLIAPKEKDLLRRIFSPLETLFERKYFADEVLETSVVRPVEKLSGVMYRAVDKRLVEGSGGALGSITQAVGELTCRMTTGQVTTYVLLMFIAAAILIGVFSEVK
jgi:NADH-quinone oxidoreductase subunit L